MYQRVVNQSVGSLRLIAVALLAAACGGDSADPLVPLDVTETVNLSPSGSMLVNTSLAGGALGFPAADAAGAEYLVVSQLTNIPLGSSRTYGLSGQASVVGVPLTRFAKREPGVAERFHGMLRARESQMAREGVLRRSLVQSPAATQPPPTVGSQRTFKVCNSISCSGTVNVAATAQFVGTHAAIYTDNANPTGFSNAELTSIGQQFDTVLYPISNDRFGAESDIDNNTVVVVLITRAVNALVTKPECNDAFIAGYFFGGDLAPGFAQDYNNGEVFYSMAPDPNGSATMCAYSTNFIRNLLPVTFIHEFQHMISFNQHVLQRGGQEEVLWLNEAMSHLAEELAGFHYDSIDDNVQSSRFFIGNFYNASLYLEDPGQHAVVTEDPPGTLEERGGSWLFLRYLVDRFGANITRTLTQTALTGLANVQAVTGANVDTLLGQWLLATYVSDLPGFTAPPELSYQSWSLRATFGSLHAQSPGTFPREFPLVPASGNGASTLVSGNLASGSGAYLLVTQAANSAEFSLAFRTSAGGGAQPVSAGPQLAVARVR